MAPWRTPLNGLCLLLGGTQYPTLLTTPFDSEPEHSMHSKAYESDGAWENQPETPSICAWRYPVKVSPVSKGGKKGLISNRIGIDRPVGAVSSDRRDGITCMMQAPQDPLNDKIVSFRFFDKAPRGKGWPAEGFPSEVNEGFTNQCAPSLTPK